MQGNIAPFSGQNGYKTIHSRIMGISNYDRIGVTGKIILYAVTAVFVITSIGALKMYSYPRYTRMEEVLVANEQMDILLNEKESKLADVIEIHEDYLLVDKDALRGLLPEGSTTDTDRLFLCFGGFMKVPGVGGGGWHTLSRQLHKRMPAGLLLSHIFRFVTNGEKDKNGEYSRKRWLKPLRALYHSIRFRWVEN